MSKPGKSLKNTRQLPACITFIFYQAVVYLCGYDKNEIELIALK
jgi:hypothetical protein